MAWKDSNGELKEGRTMKKTIIFGLALASLLAGTAVPKAAVLESPARGAVLSGIGLLSASNFTSNLASSVSTRLLSRHHMVPRAPRIAGKEASSDQSDSPPQHLPVFLAMPL